MKRTRRKSRTKPKPRPKPKPKRNPARQTVTKRSFYANGRKSSVTLEDEFWEALKAWAREECVGVSEIIRRIDVTRTSANLSSSIRVSVFDYFRTRASSPPPQLEHVSHDRCH